MSSSVPLLVLRRGAFLGASTEMKREHCDTAELASDHSSNCQPYRGRTALTTAPGVVWKTSFNITFLYNLNITFSVISKHLWLNLCFAQLQRTFNGRWPRGNAFLPQRNMYIYEKGCFISLTVNRHLKMPHRGASRIPRERERCTDEETAHTVGDVRLPVCLSVSISLSIVFSWGLYNRQRRESCGGTLVHNVSYESHNCSTFTL